MSERSLIDHWVKVRPDPPDEPTPETFELVHFSRPVLHQRASEVSIVTPEVQNLLIRMAYTMDQTGAVGLAAPQVGYGLRAIVLSIPNLDGDRRRYAYVNPEITKMGGSRAVQESCLSVPLKAAAFRRAKWIRLKALDHRGQSVRLRTDGFMAQVLQHEIDHLDGILFTDRHEAQAA